MAGASQDHDFMGKFSILWVANTYFVPFFADFLSFLVNFSIFRLIFTISMGSIDSMGSVQRRLCLGEKVYFV